jgi:AcrR family transcriptional regulator
MTPPTKGRTRSRGRPTGGTDARADILAAARTAFAESGYDGATIRAIATTAGVDPALVHHYFGTKEELFVEAVRFPIRPAEMVPAVVEGDLDGIGERIVRTFLRIASNPVSREAMLAMIKSAMTHPASAVMVREFVSRGPLARVAERLDVPDARLRVELAMSHMIGLIMARHVLGLEPLASATDEDIVELVAPTLQRYLTS